MKASLASFADCLGTALGLAFTPGRDAELVAILEARAGAHGITIRDYLDWLGHGAESEELDTLARALTVGETYFFRDMSQLHAFVEVVVRPWASRVDAATLNVLCAGCASGEEPYSLAMLLRERYPSLAARVRIDAWDINGESLSRAEAGSYSAWSLRETPMQVQQRWFVARNKQLQLSEEILGAVTFRQLNLAQLAAGNLPARRYAAIFCRNVLMYFKPAVMREVVERFRSLLVPDGYLFLGHAETLRNVSQSYSVCHSHGAFYYRLRQDAHEAEEPHVEPPRPVPVAVAAAGVRWLNAIEQATARVRALTQRPASTKSAERTATRDISVPMRLLRDERYGEALRVLRALPGTADPDALLLEATLLVNGGKVGEAKEVCAALLRYDDLNASAHYVLALCCEQSNDLEAAISHHQLAIHLDEDFAMPWVHLGLMSRRLGKVEQARRELGIATERLEHEDAARLVLFGGGFGRAALLDLCRAELEACGAVT